MIEGLKCVVTPEELRNHMLKRADYYAKKKQDAIEQLEALDESLDRAQGWFSRLTGIPTEQLDDLFEQCSQVTKSDTVQRCDTLILAYRFMADHLADDNYLLSATTLAGIGFFEPLPDNGDQPEEEGEVDQVQISPDQPRQQDQSASAPQAQSVPAPVPQEQGAQAPAT